MSASHPSDAGERTPTPDVKVFNDAGDYRCRGCGLTTNGLVAFRYSGAYMAICPTCRALAARSPAPTNCASCGHPSHLKDCAVCLHGGVVASPCVTRAAPSDDTLGADGVPSRRETPRRASPRQPDTAS